MRLATSRPMHRLMAHAGRLSLVLLIIFSAVAPAKAATGDLDLTFGLLGSGITYTDILGLNGADRIYGLALQVDGAIVAAGESGGHFAVIRYLTTGLVDLLNFSAPDGAVRTVIGTASVANDVAIQNDGKIVVVGSSSNGLRSFFTVARYNTNGTLDTAGFNPPTGYVTSTLSAGSDVATSLVLQSDGKIVVAGYTTSQFAVARYTTTGQLDTATFNAPLGFRLLTIGTHDRANDVGIQSDGKIILAGHADTGESTDFAVARITGNGLLDSTFNEGVGYNTTDFPTNREDFGKSLAIQPDDKIVVAGYSNDEVSDDIAMVRYNADGTLDTTFGAGGRVVISIGAGDDQALAVAIQPTGRIVLAGTTIGATTEADLIVLRYTDGGLLDTTFGLLGYIIKDIAEVLGVGASADFLTAIAIQTDNKIVVGGFTDFGLLLDDDNFSLIRLLSPNLAPVVTGVPKTGIEDETITFAGSDFTAHFTDPDGDGLAKVKVSTLPLSGTLALSGTAVISGQVILAHQLNALTYQPITDTNGVDQYLWNGSDGLEYAATSAVVTLTIAAVNDAPVNTVPAPFSTDEDTEHTGLSFSIADVDAGAATNFQFTLSAAHGAITVTTTSNLTLTAGNNGSHLLTYQGALADANAALAGVAYGPDADYSGADAMTFNTNDNGNSGVGGALQDTDLVTMTINPVNDPPVLNPIGAQVGDETTPITFTATASDVDTGQFLVFSLAPGAPPSAVVDPITGVFAWTPTEAEGPGDYPVTIQVEDNGTPALADTETITITVDEINNAPLFDPINEQSTDEDVPLSFVVTATDSDAGDALTYAFAADAPADAQIDPVTGSVLWTPDETASPGVYQVTFAVTDDGTPPLMDTRSMTITVNEVNDAPVLDPIGDQVGTDGVAITFDADATDPDVEQSLVFGLAPGAPSTAGIDPISGIFSWTPADEESPGVYPVTVRATDNGTPSLFDEQTMQITVTEANHAPVLNPIGNKSIDETVLLTFNASAADVDPGQTLAFALEPGSPAAASIDPVTGVFVWTPSEAEGPGVYTITVQVADNGVPAKSDAETIEITVNKVNDAPVVGTVERQTMTGDLTFAVSDFTDAFDDADGDTLVRLRITSLPARGTLRLAGISVTVGQEILANETFIGQLTYAATQGNVHGSSFTWNGSDGAVYAITDAQVIITLQGTRIYMPEVARE